MDWLLFGIFLLGCGAAATTGAMFEPGEWYDDLDKPSWTDATFLNLGIFINSRANVSDVE